MEYTKLLEEQGLSEEQIKTIVNAMKKNRIFITREEKIEAAKRSLKKEAGAYRKFLR